MPAMKKMKKADYGGKAFNTNSKVPKAGKADSRKGFVRGSMAHGVPAQTMGAGSKPGSGKANGTLKGKGGRSY